MQQSRAMAENRYICEYIRREMGVMIRKNESKIEINLEV
jgi:hypothetical protein